MERRFGENTLYAVLLFITGLFFLTSNDIGNHNSLLFIILGIISVLYAIISFIGSRLRITGEFLEYRKWFNSEKQLIWIKDIIRMDIKNSSISIYSKDGHCIVIKRVF
ncbi:MAG: hypothetical protein WCS34_09025, partial [Bacteroidales bacterium]